MHDVGHGGDVEAFVEHLVTHPFFRRLLVESDDGAVLDVGGGSGLLSRLKQSKTRDAGPASDSAA